MFKITGDFRTLRGFGERLREFSKTGMKTMSEALAKDTIQIIHEGMEGGKAPDGTKHKPLALGGGTPLLKSRRLYHSWRVQRATKNRFVVDSTDPNATRHQYGTGVYGPRKKRIRPRRAKALKVGGRFYTSVKGSPARPMIPTRGLTVQWAKSYRRTIKRVFTRRMAGK